MHGWHAVAMAIASWSKPQHQMNDRLPFDVLNEIFDFYAEEETVYHPLETLLLVCRSWSGAATNHRLLWARLKICIGYGPSQKMWLTRLPRRLERSGEYAPLEIELRQLPQFDPLYPDPDPLHASHFPEAEECNHPTHPECGCSSSAQATSKRLFKMLAGTDGELCKRWRSLSIFGFYAFLHVSLWFSYPTPILAVLRYEQLAILENNYLLPFPSLPSLHVLHVVGCPYIPLPKLDSIRELVLDSPAYLVPRPPGFSDLHTATKLERLTIKFSFEQYNIPAPYRFPDSLPNLEFLSFEGNQMPTNIATFQAPNLRCLSLTSNDVFIYSLIVNSSLPFPKLRELRLAWIDVYASKELLAVTEDLLIRCTGLTCIEGNHKALAAIARLLWRKKGEIGSYVEKMAGKPVTYRSSVTNKQFTLDMLDQEEELTALVYRLGLVQPQTSREAVWRYLDA
jgi:hypothetical protein